MDEYIAGAACEVQGLHVVLEARADGSIATARKGE